MLTAVLFPILSFFIEKMSFRNPMGIGNLPIIYGIALVVCLILFIPFEPDAVALMPQAFVSGLIAGLTFTLGRDYLASLGSIFHRASLGD